MKFDPRPWTVPMIAHVEDHERCAVLAAMGSGKTVGTLTALDHIELVEPGPSLVLAPRLVASSTWGNELEKWDHLAGKRIVTIDGTAEQRKRALRDSGADIYTLGYHNLPWLLAQFNNPSDWPWRKVVADELTRLKGFRLKGQGGQRATAFARMAHSQVRRFVGLTGTPAPNGLKDLWGQLWYIDRGERLGRTYTAFKQRWFSKSYDGHSIDPLPFAQAQIQDAIRDVCLTIDPRDYISIDEPIITQVEVDLPPRAMALHREMLKKMYVELERDGLGVIEIEAVNAAARTMKLLQITSGFMFTDGARFEEIHEAKLDALERILDNANSMPVIVAYHFVPDLARLKRRFPQGRTPDELGTNIEKEWNSGRYPLLFVHPQSAGHGLNLQDAGNILCFYGLWWDLEFHQQVIERIGPLRQYQAGHARAVFLYYLIGKGTIDELVFDRLMSKKSVQDILLAAMKERLS